MTVDEIIEILNDIRAKNDLGNENIEKALSEINFKMGVLSDDKEVVEMFKYHISELKNWFEEELNSSTRKIDSLKKLFEGVVQTNSKVAKTSEVKELFTNLSIDFNKFLADTANRKSMLENVNDKINIISEKYINKEALIDQFDLLSSNLNSVNANINKTFSEIDEAIKKLNISQNFVDIKSQIEQSASDLSLQINSITANMPFEEIGNKIDDCTYVAENLREEFRQNASVSVENSIKLADGLGSLSVKLNEIKEVLSENNDSEDIKNLIENLALKADEINNSIISANNNDSENKLEAKLDNCFRFLNLIKDLISELSISDDLKSLTSVFENNFEKLSDSINGIKDVFEDNSKANYESIINEIKKVKSEIVENNDFKSNNVKFDYINSSLDDLSANLQLLQDVTVRKYQEFSENVTSEFRSIIDENNSNNSNDTKFVAIKEILQNISADVNGLKLSMQNDDGTDLYSDLSEKFSEIEEKINRLYCTDEIINSINSLSVKIDELYGNGQNHEILEEIKDDLTIIKTEAVNSADFRNNVINEFEQIQNVSENIDNLRMQLGAQTIQIQDVLDNLENIKLNIGNNSAQVRDYATDVSDIKSHLDSKIGQIQTVSDNMFDLKDQVTSQTEQIQNVYENVADMRAQLGSQVGQIQIVSDSMFDLKDQITTQTEQIQNVYENVADVRAQLGSQVGQIQTVSDNMSEVKDFITSQAEQIQTATGNMSEVKDLVTSQAEQIQNVYDNISDVKNQFGSQVEQIQAVSDNMFEVRDLVTSQTGQIQNVYDNISDVKNQFGSQVEQIQTVSDNMFEVKDFITSQAEQIQTATANLSEVKDLVTSQAEQVQNVYDNISDVKNRFDSKFEQIQTVSDKVSDLKSQLTSNVDQIQTVSDNVFDIKDQIVSQTEQVHEVYGSVEDLKTEIAGVNQSLKEYMSAITTFGTSNNDENLEKISEKFINLEVLLNQNFQDYENKFDNLQSNLTEFVHILEGSNSDTEGKILSSLENVNDIKDELVSVREILDNVKNLSDEKFGETVSLIDAGIENIVFNINNLNESVKNGIEGSLSENISSIEEKFIDLSNILEGVKNEFSNFDENLINDISEKIENLKNEISTVNSDVVTIVKDKSDEILSKIEPLKGCMDNFANLDIEGLLSSFKSELELSFMNFTSDFSKELDSNAEIVYSVKQAYNDIFGKIENIKNTINQTVSDNIETFGKSLENCVQNMIGEGLDEKLDSFVSQLKLYFDLASNDSKIKDLIFEFTEQLTKTIGTLKTNQENFSQKTEELSANISVLSDGIKASTQTVIENCSNADTKILIEEIKNSLENVDSKVSNLSNSSKLLDLINEKVDAIASNDLYENIADEIEDLKDLISSDEKSQATEKYLKDLLLKLDNVDIEKNSEDIKNSILNAVVSLSDQITFVEEAEDIKNYVQTKTDDINENLLKVQEQLKQLTNSDDFEYKYTLQDVETDIAKLRLAINNMTVSEFEKMSEEVKKILVLIENLESNRDQDLLTNLKSDVEKIVDDIVSISQRTNKILLNSDESTKAINDGLNNFAESLFKLEDKIDSIDSREATERIESKIDNINNLLTTAVNSDKVFNQSMSYLGEWVDATTQDIVSISDNVSNVAEKTSQLPDIKDTIEKVKELIPDNKQIIEELQTKFEQQEARIDSLEKKLDKILSTLEEKDDMVLNKKMDKIEEMLSGFGSSIEKLTSYVD